MNYSDSDSDSEASASSAASSAGPFSLELLGGRRVHHVDDQQVGVVHQGDARRQGDLPGGELGTRFGAFDRDDQHLRNRQCLGFDLDGVGLLGDQGAVCSLALDVDADLDDHLLAATYHQQIGVLDGAADRVDVESLGQRQLFFAVDVEGQHRVGAGVAQHRGEVVSGQFQVLRVSTVAVEDGGNVP